MSIKNRGILSIHKNLLDRRIKLEGTTSLAHGHIHEFIIFEDGSGLTISTFGEAKDHIHYIKDFTVNENNSHRHKVYQGLDERRF